MRSGMAVLPGRRKLWRQSGVLADFWISLAWPLTRITCAEKRTALDGMGQPRWGKPTVLTSQAARQTGEPANHGAHLPRHNEKCADQQEEKRHESVRCYCFCRRVKSDDVVVCTG